MLNDRMKTIATQQTKKLVLKGKTIKYNNLLQNGQFNDTSNWGIYGSTSGGSLSASNHTIKITYNGTFSSDYSQGLFQEHSLVVGHKYACLFSVMVNNDVRIQAELNGDRLFLSERLDINKKYNLGFIATIENTYNDYNMFYPTSIMQNGDTMQISNVILVDLTECGLDYVENINEFYATDLGKAIKNGYYPPYTTTNKLVSLTSPFTFKREIEYNNLIDTMSNGNHDANNEISFDGANSFTITFLEAMRFDTYANIRLASNVSIQANRKYLIHFEVDTGIIRGSEYYIGIGNNIATNLGIESQYSNESDRIVLGKQTGTFDHVNFYYRRESFGGGTIKVKNFTLIDLTQLGLDRINSVADFYKTELGQEIKKGVYLPYSVENRAVGLPREYQQVEYIESNGDEYINTNYYPNDKTEIECNVSFNVSTDNRFAGTGYDSNSLILAYKSYFPIRSGSSWYDNYTYTIPTNKFVKVEIKLVNGNRALYIDGKLDKTLSNPVGTSTFQLSIFSVYESGQRANKPHKQKEFKIYDNGILVRDFIPCYRKVDNVVGMYDLVNGQFYTNQGTGAFTKGKDVGLTIYTRTKRVDLGTLNFRKYQSGNIKLFICDSAPRIDDAKYQGNVICSKYTQEKGYFTQMVDKSIGFVYDVAYRLCIRDDNAFDNMSVAEFTSYVNGTILEYETAEPLELNGINNDRVVDLGRLTWEKDGEHTFYSRTNLNMKVESDGSKLSNIKCERYVNNSFINVDYLLQEGIALSISNEQPTIFITDNKYTDATDFKNSLNGIMLTYETDRESACDTFTNTSGKVKRRYPKLKINDISMTYNSGNFRFTISTAKAWNVTSEPSPYIFLDGYETKSANDLLTTSDKCIGQSGQVVIIKDTRYTSVAQFKSAVGELQVMYLHYRPSGTTETERSVLVDHRYNKVVDTNGIEIDTD